MARAATLSAALLLAGALGSAAYAVNELNYDQLLSVVFFEDENAYQDPTGYFCRFIALKDNDDYCKVTMTYIEPKLCKVEITREMRVTWENGEGRDYFRSRDVFTLANLTLSKLREPQVDDAKKTSRQTFNEAIDVKWHEGHQYTVALDQGKYKACLVGGVSKEMSENDCAKAGVEPYAGTKTMSLLFNSENYNKALTAIRWLQKNYCPAGEPL